MAGSGNIRNLISELSWKGDETQKHREIYNQVHKLAGSNEQPPFYLLRYTICNIMHPKFLREQIPDLLQVLGQVELVRQRAVKNCVNVLQLNDTLRSDLSSKLEKDNIYLTTKEEEEIEKLLKRKPTDRETFVNLVQFLSLHHIRHLLTLGDTEGLARYREAYYGDDPAQNLPTTMFYIGWDEDEAEEVVKAKHQADDLILETMAWEDQKGLPGVSPYDDEALKEFDATFKAEVPISRMPRFINLYLNRVNSVIDFLEKLLPPAHDSWASARSQTSA